MPKQAVGRLALRAEGENWNAYYAAQATMDGALPLGSIKLSLVTRSPKLKAAFMALMQQAVGEAIKGALGEEPTWRDPVSAPPNERSGNA